MHRDAGLAPLDHGDDLPVDVEETLPELIGLDAVLRLRRGCLGRRKIKRRVTVASPPLLPGPAVASALDVLRRLAGLDPVNGDLGLAQDLADPFQVVDLALAVRPIKVCVQDMVPERVGPLDAQADGARTGP